MKPINHINLAKTLVATFLSKGKSPPNLVKGISLRNSLDRACVQ